MSAVVDLACQLIARASVTPEDAGCQDLIANFLAPQGFQAESMLFADTKNLWLRRGQTSPVLVFAGHTDVVPTGDPQAWTHPPFTPTIANGQLYGRGAADMKSSVAAFAVAAQEFVQQFPEHQGSIAMLLTSDEEGPATHGTVKVCETLQARGETLDFCIVGEPTSSQTLGDVVKNGRRGSLNGKLTIQGVQGHVAYPHLAKNPIHLALKALDELVHTEWDQGNQYFPATTLQISNIHAGTGATNVVPGSLELLFNFRFSSEVSAEQLQQRVASVLEQHALDYTIDWTLSGEPFLTPKGRLSEAASAAIYEQTGTQTELSTTGGTSDGRFIAKLCPEVIELGPLNATIHQVDEHIPVDSLEPLKNIYFSILKKLLVTA